MWVSVIVGLGCAVVGYMIGATRAHVANQRGIDELQHWIDRQAPGARPPLGDD